MTISISPDNNAATLVAALAIGSNWISSRLCSTVPHHFLFFLKTVLVFGSLKVISNGPVPIALVAENVSCPASQFCGTTAKFSFAHFLDITNIFDSWFKRIGFGSLVWISTV